MFSVSFIYLFILKVSFVFNSFRSTPVVGYRTKFEFPLNVGLEVHTSECSYDNRRVIPFVLLNNSFTAIPPSVLRALMFDI